METIKETFNLKLNVYLLLIIIPLSILGYYFAVNNESLFFLYEWMLAALVISLIIFTVKNIVSIKDNLKWIAISILTFLIQFSVIALFLGPLTHHLMFYLYYVIAIVSFTVFIITIRKNKSFSVIPVIFFIITGLFTLYIIALNAIWGSDLS